jgi:hypothetical protein
MAAKKAKKAPARKRTTKDLPARNAGGVKAGRKAGGTKPLE